ncbi:MAG: VWA domain-containing protein, partial [Planctomycetaceae bacterium]
MSFINPALLYGLGLALAPVLLHLLMKSKPKKLLFPALQLIQKRRMQNTRRLRLRHLWLLLLRVLVLGILITALTRPSLPPAEYSPSLREWLTMLAIGGCLILVYFSLLRWWKRKLVPNHVLNSRRTFLRGGLGVLAAALIALLVAWPYQKRIAAEISKPLPEVSSDLPVAAVFLFDISRSMDYRLKGKTRLEMAREIATEHLAALPSRSQVAVGDTSSSADFPFQVDLAAAQSRIESLKTKAASSPLNQGLRTALALHEDDRRRTLAAQGDVPIDARADQLVREIYIFTDRAASAWQASAGPFLTQELERLDWVGVYLIDVGVESHQNAALTNLVLPEQSVAEGEDVFITADVSAQGYDGRKVTVEFYADGENGQSVKQDQRNVTLTESSSQLVEFAMRSARPGITQGEVRLASGDPFKADDRLRFSVISRPGARVLVIAEAESAEANEDLEQRLLAGVKSDAGALIEILTLLNFECD